MERGIQHISNEETKQLLGSAGLKATPQRMAIYQEVYGRCDHPSADKVHEAISELHPSVSLGTVYKTLDTLVNVGLLSRVATNEGLLRYDANPVQHHHLYLADSGEIVDYYDEELVEVIRKHLDKKQIGNFEIENIRLHISGRRVNPDSEIKH